jgi:redox-sensing transcriptional repressor
MLPRPVVQRLPRYITFVHELVQQGVSWVSSAEIANVLGLTSSTVRQDLSHLDLTGVAKRGYGTSRMEKALRRELGTHKTQRIVIVGAGNLGCALALHGGLAESGFQTRGIFDDDPEVIGARVGRFKVRSVDTLDALVRRDKVELGLIAVPTQFAQEVADRLVAAGVKGLLNLSHIHVQVPEGTALVDARLMSGLQELSYAVRSNASRVTGKSRKVS